MRVVMEGRKPHVISYLLNAVLIVFEICGLIVFLAWVVVRAWREIKDIFRGGAL
jgi:hypothetical protein